jgi:hypothetical protein
MFLPLHRNVIRWGDVVRSVSFIIGADETFVSMLGFDAHSRRMTVMSPKLAAVAVSGMLATALSLPLAPPAFARTKCDGHVTAQGDCVSREKAAHARRSAVIRSQPKSSESAYPVLPSEDTDYRYPNQLNPDPNRPTRIGRVPPPSSDAGGGGGGGGIIIFSAPSASSSVSPSPAAAPLVSSPAALPPPPPPMAAPPMMAAPSISAPPMSPPAH